MSKLQFFDIKAEEMVQMYDSTFSKKDAILTGKRMVDNVIESGNVGIHEFMSTIVRLKNVIDTAEGELRLLLPYEKTNVNGVDFNPVDGGNTVNYSDDEIYATLKAELDARVNLLKLAQKQETIDLYGNLVPKVSITPRKSSITIKF
jgi:hypothetical protein